VQTKFWTLSLYCDADTLVGARLYNGIDNDKKLIAICEQQRDKVLYAYKTDDGLEGTNDYDGIRTYLGSKCAYDITGLKKIEPIIIEPQIKMPSVSEAGIEKCLEMWRMGATFRAAPGWLHFQLVTNKVEYAFSIQDAGCNVYCCASINVPTSGGMLGDSQYFRLRNLDGNDGFRQVHCNLGNEIVVPPIPEEVYEIKTWTQGDFGNFWPVKCQSDDEIVLDGCSGDEYIYRQDHPRNEFFAGCKDPYLLLIGMGFLTDGGDGINQRLMPRVRELRVKLEEEGVFLPTIRIRDNANLSQNEIALCWEANEVWRKEYTTNDIIACADDIIEQLGMNARNKK
jgi:hypothetical protein